MIYAKVSDINGKVYDVQFSNNLVVEVNDLTEKVLHRLHIRGTNKRVFIQGNKIVNIYIYEQDNK